MFSRNMSNERLPKRIPPPPVGFQVIPDSGSCRKSQPMKPAAISDRTPTIDITGIRPRRQLTEELSQTLRCR